MEQLLWIVQVTDITCTPPPPPPLPLIIWNGPTDALSRTAPSHMGKLSQQWQRARINITPSTLQVQCEIDESAAHCCLIVSSISLEPDLSITLSIITHFCATVHLLKHTRTGKGLTPVLCIWDTSMSNVVVHLIRLHATSLRVDRRGGLLCSCRHTRSH